MKWTPQEDARLLVHILKVHKLKIDYPAVAVAMSEDVGEQLTAVAITRRIDRIRNMSKQDPDAADGSSTSQSTPKKAVRKRARPEGDEAAAGAVESMPKVKKPRGKKAQAVEKEETENEESPASG